MKKISYFTIILILYVFLIVFLSTKLTPNTYWLNINSTDNSGNPFDIDYAYNSIFLQSTGIIIGSVFAFLIAQLLDVFIFQKIKKITKGKFIWLRATGSTLISQLIDSFVVLTIAFYFLAPEGKEWSINQVFVVGFDNYTFKFFVAIIITPFIYLAHYLIDSYLGKDLADLPFTRMLSGPMDYTPCSYKCSKFPYKTHLLIDRIFLLQLFCLLY